MSIGSHEPWLECGAFKGMTTDAARVYGNAEAAAVPSVTAGMRMNQGRTSWPGAEARRDLLLALLSGRARLVFSPNIGPDRLTFSRLAFDLARASQGEAETRPNETQSI